MPNSKWTAFILLNFAILHVCWSNKTISDMKQEFKKAWSYNIPSQAKGPEQWNIKMANQCGPSKTRQSPIDIDTDSAVYVKTLADINIVRKSGKKINAAYISNNGYTLGVKMESDYEVSGGGLGSTFKVAGLHFHWGSDDDRGSEHTVDGISYPIEMHVVMYNSDKFQNLNEAINSKERNPLAVLGTLFHISADDNEYFKSLTEGLSGIIVPDKSVKKKIVGFDFRLLLPKSLSKYYRYEGSLTTPSCNELVLWTVFAQPSYISKNQLSMFRELLEGLNITVGSTTQNINLENNFRPPQPLQNRTINVSFKSQPSVSYQIEENNGAAFMTHNALTYSILILTCLFVKHLS